MDYNKVTLFFLVGLFIILAFAFGSLPSAGEKLNLGWFAWGISLFALVIMVIAVAKELMPRPARIFGTAIVAAFLLGVLLHLGERIVTWRLSEFAN